jgi:hypothetical protein
VPFLSLAAAFAGTPEPLYHRAADVAAQMAAACGDPEEIGRTVQDRPILAWRAGAGDRRLLVLANIHALEWVPTEVALAFALAFCAAPVAGVQAVIVPTFNADGRARVEEDLAAGRNAYRRGNAQGVDLNRDWSVHRDSTAIWKAIIPRRYAVSPASLSQPETRALDALAARERFDAAASLHAFGGFFYYPWAGRQARTPDQDRFREVGREMRDAMTRRPYRPMQLGRWAFFFRGLGMELDHLYGRYGTLAFLVETTRSGIQRPADLKSYFRWYNPRDPGPHAEQGVRYVMALARAVGEGRATRGQAPFPEPTPG